MKKMENSKEEKMLEKIILEENELITKIEEKRYKTVIILIYFCYSL
jgi:hypothetical protein